MIQYRLRLNPEIQSDVAHFAPLLKRKVKNSLKVLQTTPFLGKSLMDELEGFWSYPASHHRIIYTVNEKNKEIVVIMIAPRYEVYELLLQGEWGRPRRGHPSATNQHKF